MITSALEVGRAIAERVQRSARASAFYAWIRGRLRYAASNVVEYVFVDPATWDGQGEIVEDPGVVSFWRAEYVRWFAQIERARLAGERRCMS